MDPDYVRNNYTLFTAGVDTGAADAVVFTLTGVKYKHLRVPMVGIINRFY
jgi:hypothetical protein